MYNCKTKITTYLKTIKSITNVDKVLKNIILCRIGVLYLHLIHNTHIQYKLM